jgi:hypothetical protein
MAHHVFRRCILADLVPPVPPVPPMAPQDDRLALGFDFALTLDGIEFGQSMCGLSTLGNLFVQPLPPGMDTGLGYYRLELEEDFATAFPISGMQIWGSTNPAGLA